MDSTSNSSIEKCTCDKSLDVAHASIESDSSNCSTLSEHHQTAPSSSGATKEKKLKKLFNLRRNFPPKRSKKHSPTETASNTRFCNSSSSNNSGGCCCTNAPSSSKSSKWSIKFACTKKEPKVALNASEVGSNASHCCRCKCYRRLGSDSSLAGNLVNDSPSEDANLDSSSSAATSNNNNLLEEVLIENGVDNNRDNGIPHVEIEQADGIRGIYGTASSVNNIVISAPFIDVNLTIHEDCDEAARIARAREIEQGVEAPANFRPVRRVQLLCSSSDALENDQNQAPRRLQLVCPPDLSVDSLRALFQNHVQVRQCPLDSITGCHTQVDFIHCLVPDLLDITNCSFYWGKMDRYEAERLLDGKQEGTFLLRDSAQEEFLFSVSFRKYGRSLHARIEQWNHRFSFDSHDPCVYTSDTVCGLIEHYKDPSSVMFFEPMLTWPLHRNFTFSLQHLARAVIVSRLTYDNINHLQLPKSLKAYLKEYHYRQKVRVERFDDDVQWLEVRNIPP